MNTKLLKMVRDKILEEPRQFNMQDWFSDELPNGKRPANCGTAACIAGWAVTIAKGTTPKEEHGAIWDIGPCILLGLEGEQAERLFYEENWPKQFKSKANTGLVTRARRAADRIDYFIRTGGK